METIVGYGYKIYYGSTLICEDEGRYDTEEEAREAAEVDIDAKIEMWKLDDSWHEWDSRDEFDVVIEDITEEM